ncbi:hypothetical protein REPUB_Repub20aG0066200 [Reevesia pubescens]
MKLWIACFSVALWSPWLARNEAIFYSKAWNVEEILFLTKVISLYKIRAIKVETVSVLGTSVPNYWKFNVDGSAYGKPGPASCGGVLRDCNCNIAAIFSGLLRVLDSNEAELVAIRHALKVFKNSRKNINNEIDVDVAAIGLLEFSNIFKEANGMVDALAKSVYAH